MSDQRFSSGQRLSSSILASSLDPERALEAVFGMEGGAGSLPGFDSVAPLAAGDGPGPQTRQERHSHQLPSPAGSFDDSAYLDDSPSFDDLGDPADGFGAGLDGAGSATESGSDGKAPARKKRRRGGRRRTKARSTSADGSADGDAEPKASATTDEADAPAEKRKTRTRRRSRKKTSKTTKRAASDEDEVNEPTEAREADTSSDEDGERPKKRRRRGSRGGRKHKNKKKTAKASDAVDIETLPGEDDDLPALADLPDDAELVEDGGKKKAKTSRRKKKSRKKTGGKAKAKTSDEDGESGGKKRKKRRRKKADADADLDADPIEEEPTDRKILVNAGDPEETRVIVVEDGRISDLQMTVKKHVSYVNDIYRGRVVNLEPAIGAAFVDFGQGRNGFLHASDVLPSYGEDDWKLENLLHTPIAEDDDSDSDDDSNDSNDDGDESGESEGKKKTRKKSTKRRSRTSRRPRRPRLPIDKLLKKGQMVAVQITKDAIGDKGPTLTTYVSIPGRYLVLMPSLERTGVSRKIEDERERRRLKRILSGLEIPDGMGVIVRTAGVGKTKKDIQRDLEYLLLAWEDFSRRLKSGRNPAPLYQESDVAIRTMRDLYTSTTKTVVVDDEKVFDRVVEFTKKLMPEHVERIERHDGPRPLFHSHGIEQDFEKIFSRRVELPSGGSIVIDQTEALVAIDVNSGRTREKGADFEDIALKTNLEAAPEIARQIRLRDLGGIIVLDYIDMMRMNSRRKVEKATREALGKDRARSKIGRISQFGLLELTRQRLGPGLSKLVYDTCSTCRGTGRRRSPASRAQAILRRLGTALLLKGFTSVEVRAHPEVIEFLKKNLKRELDQLEHDSGRKLILMSVPEQVEDSVLHYLRADGREVRPGGRRKR